MKSPGSCQGGSHGSLRWLTQKGFNRGGQRKSSSSIKPKPSLESSAQKKLLGAGDAERAKDLRRKTQVIISLLIQSLRRALERDDSPVAEVLVFPLPNTSNPGSTRSRPLLKKRTHSEAGYECAIEHEANMGPANWSRVSASLARSCHRDSARVTKIVSQLRNYFVKPL